MGRFVFSKSLSEHGKAAAKGTGGTAPFELGIPGNVLSSQPVPYISMARVQAGLWPRMWSMVSICAFFCFPTLGILESIPRTASVWVFSPFDGRERQDEHRAVRSVTVACNIGFDACRRWDDINVEFGPNRGFLSPPCAHVADASSPSEVPLILSTSAQIPTQGRRTWTIRGKHAGH